MLHTDKHDKRKKEKSRYTFVVILMVLLICLLVTSCDLMFGNLSQIAYSASNRTGVRRMADSWAVNGGHKS